MGQNAIMVTDYDWYEFFYENELPNTPINFWTPTPWRMKQLDTNSSLFFLLKSPIRKIGGFGKFYDYLELSIDEAWDRFGLNNGVYSKSELLTRNNFYTSKHSTNDYRGLIGCILITNAEFLSESDFFPSENINVTFPKQVVKYKYFADDIIDLGAYQNFSFEAINENFSLQQSKDANRKFIPQKQRVGQADFRLKVLKAYNGRCAITGTMESSTLEAAHIQPYLNKESNHIQNGICLRADIHKLFDSYLLTLNDNYEIMISEKLTETEYTELNGRTINLPNDRKHYPSVEAINSRMVSFRN